MFAQTAPSYELVTKGSRRSKERVLLGIVLGHNEDHQSRPTRERMRALTLACDWIVLLPHVTCPHVLLLCVVCRMMRHVCVCVCVRERERKILEAFKHVVAEQEMTIRYTYW